MIERTSNGMKHIRDTTEHSLVSTNVSAFQSRLSDCQSAQWACRVSSVNRTGKTET